MSRASVQTREGNDLNRTIDYGLGHFVSESRPARAAAIAKRKTNYEATVLN
ncbi:MAG: hypothetical protein H7A21_15350 [Spirochaetales bacterium]|nr:hypothetical protein [Leptospiraceae bacterium]MCP5482811.1 hypothetical protein [Spirochaetales bacterium]